MKKRVNLSKREKVILGITAGIVLSVGGYLGIYERLAERWRLLNEDIAALTLRLEASKESYRQELRIKREYEEVVASLRIGGSESDKQLKILQELSTLMEEAEVTAKTVKPLNVIEEQNFHIFNFSYDDIETEMIHLARFLDLLERRSKVSEVQECSIKSNESRYYRNGMFDTSFKISRLVYRR